MTKMQKLKAVYRVLRQSGASRADARYAAPRLVALMEAARG